MHTIEIIFVASLTTAVAFHAWRFIGAKLAQTPEDGIPSKLGRGVLGVFTFDKGTI